MTWYAWVLVAAIGLNMLAAVARIGQPREPLTPAEAIWVLIINGLFIWAVVALAVRG